MQFVYLILSLYFGRKNPLFYLIFPIALVSGPGVFVDPRTALGFDDFFLMGNNAYKDVIVVYLILINLIIGKKVNLKYILNTPVKFLSIYIIILIAFTLIQTGTSYDAINVIRLFVNMTIGFYLLALIFSTVNKRQFFTFFNVLIWITGICSVLYVLNSSKLLPIYYQEDLYKKIEFGNGDFYRDFKTIPYFGHFLFLLGVASLLLKDKSFNKYAIRFILITYPFVLLFSFTRSSLLIVFAEVLLIYFCVIFYTKKPILKTTVFSIVGGLILFFGVLQPRFENELNYFGSRLESVNKEGVSEGNVNIRIIYHAKAIDIIKRNNALLIGDGLNRKHQRVMNDLGAWEADSTIPFLLIYSGFFGVLIYYSINLLFLRRAIKYIRNIGSHPFILTLLVYVLFATISSFFMGGYRWGDPFIFYPLALILAYERFILQDKKEIFEKNKIS